MMPKVKYVEAQQHTVDSYEVVPGRIIITDNGRMYLDSPSTGKRIEITDVIDLKDENARKRLKDPLERLYYVYSTTKLWRYHDGEWHCLNPDPVYIGGTNNEAEIVPATSIPLMDSGTGIVGAQIDYARGDHRHPTDLSRAPNKLVSVYDGTPGLMSVDDKLRLDQLFDDNNDFIFPTIEDSFLDKMPPLTLKGNPTSSNAAPTNIDAEQVAKMIFDNIIIRLIVEDI